ncbi:putative vacuolar protein sorting-associated protein 74 [Diplodia seriata]|uniref:Acyl carrier protein n=1 Tax=Diplodia seriata TaxID=420778 RepID=A0A0G2GTE4_9PEZI|nr:putative vacuolar protein sorting-associated protein 74 [Diplodia seriata]
MFRTAILRSARGAARSAARWQAPIARPAVPALRAQSRQQLPAVCFQAVRCYSAGGALNQDEVQGRILDLLKNFDKVQDASKLSPTSHFSNDLGLDSLDTVEVVMAIEEEFSIEIPDKDADQIHSVDKAVEYILSQPDGAGAGANGDTDNDGSRVSSPVPRRNDEGPGTSYESAENGHKIAYDPRDISESAERSKQPKLTLMEEVLLMGLKDKQGYLSFWNDNISYALRGCIVIELAFRGRVSMQKDSSRRRFPLADRVIEVIDDTLTGEVLLDEALKMMKSSEKMSVASWIDLMSGETWNLMKIGYQLKQVRERLAKGLVDKGILRTEKRNFLLFDMATHPVADGGAKDEIRRRVRNLLTNRTVVLPPSQFLPEEMDFRYIRTIAMVCAAYAANVLENALSTLGHEARERAFAQVDELLAEYSQWPFARRAGGSGGIGANLGQVIQEEVNNNKDKELQLEVSMLPTHREPRTVNLAR